MSEFEYEAVDGAGARSTGRVEAESADAALSALLLRGLFPSSIRGPGVAQPPVGGSEGFVLALNLREMIAGGADRAAIYRGSPGAGDEERVGRLEALLSREEGAPQRFAPARQVAASREEDLLAEFGETAAEGELILACRVGGDWQRWNAPSVEMEDRFWALAVERAGIRDGRSVGVLVLSEGGREVRIAVRHLAADGLLLLDLRG